MSVVKITAMLVVLGWAGTLSVFDLACRRLPNTLTVGGAAVILAAATDYGRGLPALLGAACLGVLYLVVHLADPAALGGGDVKLAFAVGGLTGALGLPVWVLAAVGAPLLTAGLGLVVLVVLRAPAAVLPHGPSMCVASLAAAALTVL